MLKHQIYNFEVLLPPGDHPIAVNNIHHKHTNEM